MNTRTVSALLLAALTGCQMATRSVKPAPLELESELWVYLQPLPGAAERLGFTVESVVARRQDGAEFPLTVALSSVSYATSRRQRLLARGRLPDGSYSGLSIRVAKAALHGEGALKTDLLVAADPARVAAPFAVARGRARVVAIDFQPGQSMDKDFGFKPTFVGAVPAMPMVELLGFVSNTGSDAITVFDQHARRAVAVLAAGRDPRGMAIDTLANRLFVALSGDDQVASYDLITGAELGRARLQPGDRPAELGLTADGRLLVTTNAGSNSVSFVDAFGLVELTRVRAGQEPTVLLMDRMGRRAYVFNRGTSNVTVVDTATRAAVGTFPLEGEAARAAISRNGDRMYVVTPLSAHMTVLAVPSMAVLNRLYVGYQAVSVHVNPRTDYVYVSQGGAGTIQVFAPLAPLPSGRLELAGQATWLATDVLDDVLYAVVPSERSVAGVEQNARKVVPGFDVGEDPYAAALAGPRN